MFWPPLSSVEISVSSENSAESTLEALQSVVMPLWSSVFKVVVLTPLLGIIIWPSQPLSPPSEFAPLIIGADIVLDKGVESPSPMPAGLSEPTVQFLFEILMLYKPEKKIKVRWWALQLVI